jgi:rhamnogalacturonyl hydrolase YesR
MVPDPLAPRLRAFAAKEDELILPDLQKAMRGDAARRTAAEMAERIRRGTLANQAMFCLARYEQTKNDAYRDLLVAIADQYLDSQPEEDVDAWPLSFAHAISTEVAAWRFTKRQVYLDRARASRKWRSIFFGRITRFRARA